MCFFDSVLPKKHNLNQVIPGHIIAESMVYVGPVFSGPGCSVRRLAPDGVGVSQDVVELFFRLFFTDCTMVNHHHTTTWENLLEFFSKHHGLLQIQDVCFFFLRFPPSF